MAVTQISRIQHRRGLEQDLPQLASAELGWSIDTRQLYIGNGTLAEGAPLEGVTRVLTEYDITDLASNLSIAINSTNYTFVGNAAGYTAQTGPSSLTPVIRSYQQKFDDVINVRDFGAIGNNSTDDTDAINRAIQQIYKSTVSPTEPRARRTLYFPGGTYLTSSEILIPPYAKLLGDGSSSTILRQTMGNKPVANVCDSLFQTSASLGSGSATLPIDIEIHGIQFLNANSSITTPPVLIIDSASNVKIYNSKFQSNAGGVLSPNLISIGTTVASSSKLVFDSCEFANAGNAIAVIGTDVRSLRIINSAFDAIANTAVFLSNINGFTSLGNYYNINGSHFVGNSFNSCSLGDNFINNPGLHGLRLGDLLQTTSQSFTVTNINTAIITPVSNSSGQITYQLLTDSNVRIGTVSFTKTDTKITYYDNYVETDNSLNANISANSQSILISLNSGSARLDYNFTLFRSENV